MTRSSCKRGGELDEPRALAGRPRPSRRKSTPDGSRAARSVQEQPRPSTPRARAGRPAHQRADPQDDAQEEEAIAWPRPGAERRLSARPVGAVVVRDSPAGPAASAHGYNRAGHRSRPTAHAETSLRHAAKLSQIPPARVRGLRDLERARCRGWRAHAREARATARRDPKRGGGLGVDIFGNSALTTTPGRGRRIADESGRSPRSF